MQENARKTSIGDACQSQEDESNCQLDDFFNIIIQGSSEEKH